MQTIFQRKAINPCCSARKTSGKESGSQGSDLPKPCQTSKTEMTTGPGLLPASSDILGQAALNTLIPCTDQELHGRGARAAKLVECPTSAQVMISRFVSLSSALGSLLSALSPLQILCPPLSLKEKKKNCMCVRVNNKNRWGAWVAQSVKRPTSARSRSRGP